MMNYRQLETDILSPLRPLTSDGVELTVLPQIQSAFSKAFNARVYIGYGGSKYDQPTATDIIIQNEIINIWIILQSRLLDSNIGIYSLIERIKTLLLGFQPQHTTRLYLSSIEFDKYEENIWNYIMTFECRRIQAQQLQDWEPDGLPLNPENITYRSSMSIR